MTITVQTTSRPNISVVQGSQGSGSAVIIKKTGDLTVQGLSNVVSTDLQDGYTLIYDSDTNKFITQNVGNITLTSVDGGIY